MDILQFEERKRDHLRHALDSANQADGAGSLDRIRLVHEALPDLDLEEVSLSSQCLGSSSETPFFIAAMTAGHADAPRLNRQLALACSRRGWAMGVGSQRRELESFELTLGSDGGDRWSKLRAEAPALRLYANIGLSQLPRARLENLQRLVGEMDATALVVHANALQEGLQREGTPQFGGSIDALARLCEGMKIPVILKETGCGFSEGSVRRVACLGLAAIDVSGLGGTHWGRIEGARAGEVDALGRRLTRAAQVFKDWGISTVQSVLNARKVLGSGPVETWASGGVRSGLDAAKLMALGAFQVGFAKPALEAAQLGDEGLDEWMEQIEFETRLAMFCSGMKSTAQLRGRETVWTKHAP